MGLCIIIHMASPGVLARNNAVFKILLVDGYIDEPGCLGVPPYLAPLPRYLAGAIATAFDELELPFQFTYKTIDQLRAPLEENLPEKLAHSIHLCIILSGVAVPGKYLGGTPISYREIKQYGQIFSHAVTVLCGPAPKSGIGQEGGKAARPVSALKDLFDLILIEDAEMAIYQLFRKHYDLVDRYFAAKQPEFARMAQEDSSEIYKGWEQLREEISGLCRPNVDSMQTFSVAGPPLIVPQHPNFTAQPEGNLICEIETFRGCPRYKSGGCRFCVEPIKGPTQHRQIKYVLDEISALYQAGVRHIRLGGQTDFYAYHHLDFDHPRYPRPNPNAIQALLQGIRERCPEIETLHIDNVNALNFALYPQEAERITQYIVEYCTPCNVAAIGVEAVDEEVIRQNNLKVSAPEVELAVKAINIHGKAIGENGNPCFLPGLNFIMGLPGETNESLKLVHDFLHDLVAQDVLIRRINLRKFLIPANFSPNMKKSITKHLNKFQSKYFHWKQEIREKIDRPMLKVIYPMGRVLRRVYTEKWEGEGTLGRQVGTYPITCYVPKKLPLHRYHDLIVVNHGFRSLVCLKSPVELTNLSQKELEAVDGIGKKRAQAIQAQNPKTEDDWKEMEPEIQLTRQKLTRK